MQAGLHCASHSTQIAAQQLYAVCSDFVPARKALPLALHGKCMTGKMRKLIENKQSVNRQGFHLFEKQGGEVHANSSESLLRRRGKTAVLDRTYLFESSAIPASALYHAKNAARKPKNPPALITGVLALPSVLKR